MSAAPQDGYWDSEDQMQRLCDKKRRLEEAEAFNAPETMRKKREAVKEEAKRIPIRSASTELEFDDAIEGSEQAQEASADADRATSSVAPREKLSRQKARWLRRSRASRRRKEAMAHAAATGDDGAGASVNLRRRKRAERASGVAEPRGESGAD